MLRYRRWALVAALAVAQVGIIACYVGLLRGNAPAAGEEKLAALQDPTPDPRTQIPDPVPAAQPAPTLPEPVALAAGPSAPDTKEQRTSAPAEPAAPPAPTGTGPAVPPPPPPTVTAPPVPVPAAGPPAAGPAKESSPEKPTPPGRSEQPAVPEPPPPAVPSPLGASPKAGETTAVPPPMPAPPPPGPAAPTPERTDNAAVPPLPAATGAGTPSIPAPPAPPTTSLPTPPASPSLPDKAPEPSGVAGPTPSVNPATIDRDRLVPASQPTAPATAADPCPWSLRMEIVKGRTQLEARIGKEVQFRVSCAQLSIEAPRGCLNARGDVKITGSDLDGYCDGLTINWQDDHVFLEGKAHLKCLRNGQDVELNADRLAVKLSTSSSVKGVGGRKHAQTDEPPLGSDDTDLK